MSTNNSRIGKAWTSRHGRTWRSGIAACTAASLALLPTGSAGAADVVVTLDRAFLERAVEDAITRTAIAAEPRLHWGHVS
ncbi:MAG TPA: hypothetical protein VK524_30245, partial [Polyangiaceae bacterium]|nr:hypothetical protein [Polyangiaceae bacterium]